MELDHRCADFLTTNFCDTFLSAVITNPPYSQAEEFIRHSQATWPCADLVFLLRLGFLASAARLKLWEAIGTPDVWVLPNRPSFTGHGTDSADYAWYHWPSEARNEGDLRVLADTPKGERGG
jgi:hypothetical protein